MKDQQNRIKVLDEAIKYVKEQVEYLAKELVKIRATDCMPQIRRLVIEMVSELEP